MVFLSIIVPFDTAERYLKDCLDSLAYQKFDDCEIIIILNGNKENVDELIDSYNDLNIITKRFDERLGVGKARNEGLDCANGEYVYFMDADDYLDDNALVKLVDVAKNSNADFINGERISTSYIYERFHEQYEKRNTTPLKKGKLSDMEFAFRLLSGPKIYNKKEFLSVLHALIKRDNIGSIRFDENDRFYSDYTFIADIIPNLNTFIGVEDAVYAKRTRDDPINLPSLINEDHGNPYLSYFNAYKKLLNEINSLNDKNPQEKYKLIKDETAYRSFRYFYNVFGPKFVYNGNNDWRTFIFKDMQELSHEFNMSMLSFWQRREVKAIQHNKIRTFKLLVKARVNYKKLKRMLKHRWRFKRLIYMER